MANLPAIYWLDVKIVSSRVEEAERGCWLVCCLHPPPPPSSCSWHMGSLLCFEFSGYQDYILLRTWQTGCLMAAGFLQSADAGALVARNIR